MFNVLVVSAVGVIGWHPIGKQRLRLRILPGARVAIATKQHITNPYTSTALGLKQICKMLLWVVKV